MLAVQWTADEREAWRPPERLRVSEWADRHRYLDPIASGAGARYSSALTPYARAWMDSANEPHVRQVTICAGTQIGKSETMHNVIGYAVAQDPGPAMLVVPRNVDIPTAVQRRILPMLQASPVLLEQLTDSARDLKKRELAFRRSVLYVRSSQSPADLASVPVRYLLVDEADKFPRWAGKEASPIDLARERTRTFWNSIVYVVSTPTTRDGTIQREFDDGDRRRYHVPCPHCGRFQTLRWQQVDFGGVRDVREMRKRRTATYRCEACAKAIPDERKREMLLAGVWVPDGVPVDDWRRGAHLEDREPHRSFHLWAAYSPWLAWWQLAAQFLASKDDPARLQNWTNSWLAEPWEERIEAPVAESVAAAVVRGHRMGQVPPGVLVATAGVDVQGDRLVYVVRGWGMDDESWLLTAGQVTTWDELADVLFRNVWTTAANAGAAGVRVALIDSRYRRDEVVDFARRFPQVRLGAGVDRMGPLPFTTTALEKHPRTGQRLPNSLLVWSITVGLFKDALAHSMRNPEKWHVPEDLPDGYERQMASEHKIRVRHGGHEHQRWVVKPGSAANHFWDCEVYALAAARMVRVDTLRTRPANESPQQPKRRGPPPRQARSPFEDYPLLSRT